MRTETDSTASPAPQAPRWRPATAVNCGSPVRRPNTNRWTDPTSARRWSSEVNDTSEAEMLSLEAKGCVQLRQQRTAMRQTDSALRYEQPRLDA